MYHRNTMIDTAKVGCSVSETNYVFLIVLVTWEIRNCLSFAEV